MINIQSLDKDSPEFTEDKELFEHDGDRLRNFYSLTGPPRRDYIIQLAQAEAERIKIIRHAQAEGMLAIRQAEAEGLRAIGEALARLDRPELVLQMATLMALQEVAKQLANGKATKLFVPHGLGDLLSLAGSLQGMLGNSGNVSS
jgi:hypothetical protein